GGVGGALDDEAKQVAGGLVALVHALAVLRVASAQVGDHRGRQRVVERLAKQGEGGGVVVQAEALLEAGGALEGERRLTEGGAQAGAGKGVVEIDADGEGQGGQAAVGVPGEGSEGADVGRAAWGGAADLIDAALEGRGKLAGGGGGHGAVVIFL